MSDPARPADLTPILAQYRRIKERYPETILLFRMGDFYETFFDDAQETARILGITLTSRPLGKAGRVPLAGVPYRTLDTHLARLVAAGRKVAVCDQLEDPRTTRTLVRRDVVEVVTPGSVLRPSLLEDGRNRYLLGLCVEDEQAGVAFADVSTGEFRLAQFPRAVLREEIERLDPSEIIFPDGFDLTPYHERGAARTALPAYLFSADLARDKLTGFFHVTTLDGFGAEDKPLGIRAAGAVLGYLEETQKTSLAQLRTLGTYERGAAMVLDQFTARNLELLERFADRSREGSLLAVLDETETPMGARTLRRWLTFPLRDVDAVRQRQDAVAELAGYHGLGDLTRALAGIGDLERVAARVACERAHARDLVGLKDWLGRMPAIVGHLDRATAPELVAGARRLAPPPGLVERIAATLVDAPPLELTEGGLVRAGFSSELDELRALAGGAKEYLARLQEEERSRTGIATLKVGYNSVFGYYLEVAKSQLARVPGHYVRRQTLTSGERFVTEELKEQEAKILGAEERSRTLEHDIFLDLRRAVAAESGRLLDLAGAVGELDALTSLARVARRPGYVRPTVTDGATLVISAGRHPMVERVLGARFVPNDTRLDAATDQILLITGPNMAGKSTYLRQTALLAIMAQVGAWVPAASAEVGIVDRIFTRIGASDDLARGVSTFLAEMMETANILNNATARSLVILDEIGRGTSTHDGLAIAWAVVEHLHRADRPRPRTLFATHYHELTDVARLLERVRNYHFAAREHGDDIIFLRTLAPGESDRSYGIAVARLAGLPPSVIERAREVLADFVQGAEQSVESLSGVQLTFAVPTEHPLLDELRALDLERLAPLDALTLLSRWQKKLGTRPKP